MQLSKNEPVVFRPQPGPQERFLASPADIVVFGGQAGGGKTFAALIDHARWINVPDYSGIILRREAVDLEGGGSIWDASRKMFGPMGGRPREGKYMDWRWPNGAVIEFGSAQYEKDVESYQGRELAVITLEEATHFTEYQFWYLLSRNRSTCGVKPYMRLTCNPDPDSFIAKLIDWWIGGDGYPMPERDGAIRWIARGTDDELLAASSAAELLDEYPHLEPKDPKSLTFIRSTLEDNPALNGSDPEYRSRLRLLPKVERERLLGGNWRIRASKGDYFPSHNWQYIEAIPSGWQIAWTVRGWDLAASAPSRKYPDPDWTRGVRLSQTRCGKLIVEDMRSVRAGPAQVEELIRNTADEDGKRVTVGLWQDPAAAGKAHGHHLVVALSGHKVELVPTSQNKIGFAKPVTSQQAVRNIYLLRGPWNEDLVSEAERFPLGGHDDAVDALSLAFHVGHEIRRPLPPRQPKRQGPFARVGGL